MTFVRDSAMGRRLIESLYAEAMLLADEARSYFDDAGRGEREQLDPLRRVTFSCESLKVTTRLMHAIAWLLTQRAVLAGEILHLDALHPSRRLGAAPETEAAVLAGLPEGARALIRASRALHRRVARLDVAQARMPVTTSPALSMIERLERSF